MTINLSNHSIWQEFAEILNKLDLDTLVANHLKACNYRVIGYQDENNFMMRLNLLPQLKQPLSAVT